jgi:hypothetical protein
MLKFALKKYAWLLPLVIGIFTISHFFSGCATGEPKEVKGNTTDSLKIVEEFVSVEPFIFQKRRDEIVTSHLEEVTEKIAAKINDVIDKITELNEFLLLLIILLAIIFFKIFPFEEIRKKIAASVYLTTTAPQTPHQNTTTSAQTNSPTQVTPTQTTPTQTTPVTQTKQP